MATYLIYHNSKGRIIEIPPGTPSEEYGRLQTEFAKEAGKDSRKSDDFQYADMIHLWENQRIEGVWYDYDLVSINGAHFRLIAMPDIAPAQLEAAKEKIRRDHDVVGMSVIRIKEMI